MEKLEILKKWKSIEVPQEKIDAIVEKYSKRYDEVVINRDTYRSPDKKGEEKKYKYLEKVNTDCDNGPDDNIITPKRLMDPFSSVDTKIHFSLPNDMLYYYSKNEEIGRLLDDPMKIGLLSLGDIIEDVFHYNYSLEKESQKIVNVNQTIERLTKAIMNIQEDGKPLIKEKFGEFVVEPFGSSVNGIFMHSKENKSDLDLALNFYYNPALDKEEVLNAIIPAIHAVSGKKFELVLDSKVPIFKYTDLVTGEE